MFESEPSWHMSADTPKEVAELLVDAVMYYQDGEWSAATNSVLHAVYKLLHPEPDGKDSAMHALTQAFSMVNKFAENNLSVNDVGFYMNLEV